MRQGDRSKMNEEIDDAGSFLQDFTAVSDWEILILRIEELIAEWKLTKPLREPPLQNGDFSNSSWEVLQETIDFANYTIFVKRYKLIVQKNEKNIDVLDESSKYCQAMTDLRTYENDFDKLGSMNNHIPQISTWYGLRDFVVVTSGTRCNIKECDIKLLLSSIHIAINNTGCEVPIFIQCLEPWQQFFLGVCESKDLCVTFNTIHLQKLPSHCHYLIGLLDLFKGKIASSVALETVNISAMFTYALSDFSSSTWMQEPPDFDFLQGKTLGIEDYSTLPFGAILDPLKNLYLYVSWLKLLEDTVVDSQSYSDFDPLLAPFWSLSIEMVETIPALLSKYFEDFIRLYKNQMTLKRFLDDVSAVESVIGNSKFPIIRSSNRNNDKIVGEPCLKDSKYYNSVPSDIMRSILKYLFLDDKQDAESVDKSSPFILGSDVLKASRSHDLVWRLAVVSAHVSQVMGDANALAHIWYEFSQEMRYRWDNSINIEGIMEGFPNSRTSLLHQKLQMLNVCIDRRKARDVAALQTSTVEETSSDSEDEFYECSDEEYTSDSVSENKKQQPSWNRPVGRLAKFGNEYLLDTGDQMYIPVTQEPVPKTEDQLEQDAEVMLTLETGPSRSETIARIMSASLLSDMESFKAANPGAIFEDFIRWYSPRDWIEEENPESEGEKKGHLSARMLIPNNMWQDVWDSARPVPARRQRRLFDDTKEAEKILHYFESRSVSQIVDILLPSLTQAVIEKLGQECENKAELPQLEALFERLKTTATKITRERAEADKYQVLSEQVYSMEVIIARLTSVQLKLGYTKETLVDGEVRQFLSDLVSNGEAVVTGGARGRIGSRVCTLFQEDRPSPSTSAPAGPRSNSFPAPLEKEFVLRVMAPRPSPTSSLAPQVMRAILKNNSYRLLGAFTEDCVFT